MRYKSGWVKVQSIAGLNDTESISVSYEVIFEQGDDVAQMTEMAINKARKVIGLEVAEESKNASAESNLTSNNSGSDEDNSLDSLF